MGRPVDRTPARARRLRVRARGAVLALLLLLVACGEGSARAERREALVAREVRVPADGAVLAGELTMPARVAGAGSPAPVVPVVLVVSGTGPHDRDGARDDLAGYRPFLDIARALGERGIAVLRLDDRGAGRSTGRFAGRTTADHAEDTRAALAWLRGPDGVPGARLFLLGHSEGGVVSLLVADSARTGDMVAGVVLLGTPSRPGRELARWQRARYVGADMAEWPAGRRDSALARAEAEAESLARGDPWLRAWFALDPREAARRVRAPALVLHGERDGQVPPSHADELAEALRAAGARVETRRFPATDHLLLADHDGDPRGYARLGARTVRGEVTDEIARWVHATVRAGARQEGRREGR